MTTASSTHTTSDSGTSFEYAARPAAGTRMIRISCVAYAVEEIASLANTGSAIFFGRRV